VATAKNALEDVALVVGTLQNLSNLYFLGFIYGFKACVHWRSLYAKMSVISWLSYLPWSPWAACHRIISIGEG